MCKSADDCSVCGAIGKANDQMCARAVRCEAECFDHYEQILAFWGIYRAEECVEMCEHGPERRYSVCCIVYVVICFR